MKKAVILGNRQAGLVEVPDPQPKEDWVVVKVHAAPMCAEYKGFVAGHTEVLLETIALVENPGGPPLNGQFTVGSSQLVTFRAPAGIAPGRYGVRVRVHGVESPPSWWIVI